MDLRKDHALQILVEEQLDVEVHLWGLAGDLGVGGWLFVLDLVDKGSILAQELVV